MKPKITLNPDAEIVERVKAGLKAKEGYCPCRISKTPDTKCMCKEFREQTEPGTCHCGMFAKISEN